MVMVVLIIVLLVVGAFALTKDIEFEWTKTGENTGSDFSASIVAYNNGVPVSEPVVMGSFTRSGAMVDSFVVTITWHGSGSGVDWATFGLLGSFRVSYLNEYDNYMSEFDATFSGLNVDGSWTKTLVLGTDVCKMENILYGGWFLEFRATLDASVEDVATGTVLTDSVSFAGTVNILFDSEFNLDGGWSY